MNRATVDTNVIVSGLLFDGIPGKVLDLALERRYELVLSPALIAECERVLYSKKFRVSVIEGRALLDPIINIASIVVPKDEIRVITRRALRRVRLGCSHFPKVIPDAPILYPIDQVSYRGYV